LIVAGGAICHLRKQASRVSGAKIIWLKHLLLIKPEVSLLKNNDRDTHENDEMCEAETKFSVLEGLDALPSPRGRRKNMIPDQR
jgi:hypothetical protein